MTWNRFVYKTHKWLAVGTVLFTLVWFVSGALLLFPSRWFAAAPLSASSAPPQPAFRDVRVSVPDAIAAAEKVEGGPVQVVNIRFRHLAGRLAYVVTTEKKHYLIDAISAAPIQIDQTLAREIMAAAAGPAVRIRESRLLSEHDQGYLWGELPAYRFILEDPAGTWVHVGVPTGEVRSNSRRERVFLFLAGTHTFDFLRPHTSDPLRRSALLLPAILGTLMTCFGGWILWLQFTNWRQARRRVNS